MIKRKLLITGASGFIGKNLLSRIDYDVFEISIITRQPEKIQNQHGKINIIKADLTDLPSLQNAFIGQEILINLAAEVRIAERFEETNVRGTQNLIEAISTSDSLKELIHLSSVGVVGKTFHLSEFIIDENTPEAPSPGYEETKLKSEKMLLAAEKQMNVHLTVIRPTNVFGEHHPFNALLNLMSRMKSNKIVLASKKAVVNYVYVQDVSEAILSQIGTPRPNGVLIVGKTMPLIDFYHLLGKKLKCKARIVMVPRWIVQLLNVFGIKKLNPAANQTSYSDNKLMRIFKYPIGIELGIEQTIRHYNEIQKLKE